MIFGSNQKLLMGAAGRKPAGGVQYVGGKVIGVASTDTTASLSSLSGGVSATMQDGDVCVIYFGVSCSANGTLDVGYVNTFNSEANLYQNDSFDARLRVGYLIYTNSAGGDDISLTLSGLGNYYGGIIILHAWRGIDQTTPIDVATTTAQAGNSSLINPPAITPVTSGAIIIAGGLGARSSTGANAPQSSDLSNFVSGFSDGAQAGAGSHIWTSGAFDPAQFTSDSSSITHSWAAATLALRPAP